MVGESTDINPNEKTKLTPEQAELKKWYILAFYLSQGSEDQQSDLTHWSYLDGYFKDKDVPTELPDFLKEVAPPNAHDAIGKGSERLRILERNWWGPIDTKRLKSLARHEDGSPIDFPKEILTGMIKSDLAYQYKERPGRIASDFLPDDRQDRHGSLVRRHLLMDNKVGNKTFDHLFAKMAPIVRQLEHLEETKPAGTAPDDLDSLSMEEAMQHLIFQWERNHPGERFFPQTQAA